MATSTARAIRSGDWWAIEIDEIDGVHTQARRLDDVVDCVDLDRLEKIGDTLEQRAG